MESKDRYRCRSVVSARSVGTANIELTYRPSRRRRLCGNTANAPPRSRDSAVRIVALAFPLLKRSSVRMERTRFRVRGHGASASETKAPDVDRCSVAGWALYPSRPLLFFGGRVWPFSRYTKMFVKNVVTNDTENI